MDWVNFIEKEWTGNNVENDFNASTRVSRLVRSSTCQTSKTIYLKKKTGQKNAWSSESKKLLASYEPMSADAEEIWRVLKDRHFKTTGRKRRNIFIREPSGGKIVSVKYGWELTSGKLGRKK